MSIARDMCGPSRTGLEIRLTAQLQQRDKEIERLRGEVAKNQTEREFGMTLSLAARRILEAINSGEADAALDVAQDAERLGDAGNTNDVLWAFIEFLAAGRVNGERPKEQRQTGKDVSP